MLSQIERFLKPPVSQAFFDTRTENITEMQLVATVACGFFLGLLANRAMVFFVSLFIVSAIYEQRFDACLLCIAYLCAVAIGLQRR